MEGYIYYSTFSFNSVSWSSLHNGKIFKIYFILSIYLGDLFHIIVWLYHYLTSPTLMDFWEKFNLLVLQTMLQ